MAGRIHKMIPVITLITYVLCLSCLHQSSDVVFYAPCIQRIGGKRFCPPATPYSHCELIGENLPCYHKKTKLKCFPSRLAVVFAQSIQARCYVLNEDIVGAVPTGDAPTTSEWSTGLMLTKVQLILEVWWHIENQLDYAAPNCAECSHLLILMCPAINFVAWFHCVQSVSDQICNMYIMITVSAKIELRVSCPYK